MKMMTSIGVVLLALCVATIESVDESTECTTGAGCFPDGQMPLELTNKDTAYYCCLQRNMTQSRDRLPDGTYNCSCVLDLTLESQIVDWAYWSRQQGRMCLRDDCEQAAVSTTISERFKYCCYEDGLNNSINVLSEVSTFDSDKEEFIGCRCVHQSVPTPDPAAYRVPAVLAYNSTGEVCSYDAACQDRPPLKCESRGPTAVTFCCYGSRGLVTENDGDHLTRCTCSDEVYGAQCEAKPIAIAHTTLPCLTQCDNRTNEDKCTDSGDAVRCCPNNMVVVASQSGGSFTSCTCKAQATKKCGTETHTGPSTTVKTPSSSASRVGSHFSDVVWLVFAVLGFTKLREI